MRFAIFPVHLSKVLRLPRKIDARSYEVLHLSRKIILANLHIWYSKMQPLSGNQRPDLLTSLMNMSFVLRLPRKCIFADPLQMSHACHHSWKCHKTLTFWSLLTRCTIPCACHAKRHLNLQKWSVHGVRCTFWLGNVLRATAACTFATSQLPKVVRSWCVLYIFTSKCASRHNGAHFFDISRSAPSVFCAFRLGNVLRATTACTFSTSQLPKVVRTWCVLYILASKCASRHNGVQFFISPLASWLRTRRSSERTFRPSGATNHWKNTVNRDFPTFSRISIFFLLTLSLLLFSLLIFLFSLPLPCSAFHLSILSEVWLLNFLRWGINLFDCSGLEAGIMTFFLTPKHRETFDDISIQWWNATSGVWEHSQLVIYGVPQTCRDFSVTNWCSTRLSWTFIWTWCDFSRLCRNPNPV